MSRRADEEATEWYYLDHGVWISAGGELMRCRLRPIDRVEAATRERARGRAVATRATRRRVPPADR
jgi:hypothetical protein